MAAAQTLERRGGRERLPGRLFNPGGDLSLDDVVSLAWQSLEAPGRRPTCVVCGEMLAWNSDEHVAECDTCGSTLE